MKKILIIKHGSLGDIALSLPAFYSIRNNYPQSEIYLLTEEKFINFFKKSKLINYFISNNRNESYLKTFKTLLDLVKINFELIIDLQNSERTSVYNLFFRVFHKAKICSSRSFAHYRYKIPQQGKESIITGLFNQLKLIGINHVNKIDYDWLKIDLKEKYNEPLVLFIPGVSKGNEYKQWQPEKFLELAKYFEKNGFSICIIGTKNDIDSAKPILDNCSNIINKIDKSPPEVIYSIAKESQLIISNDTGPGHLASLSNTKIIWIGNEDRISRSNIVNDDFSNKILSKSVKNIEVKQVINLVEKLI